MIIREKRCAKGWFQKKLAQKAGWDLSYLINTEKGRRNPSLEKLLSLAHALGCDVTDLLRYTKSKSRKTDYGNPDKIVLG